MGVPDYLGTNNVNNDEKLTVTMRNNYVQNNPSYRMIDSDTGNLNEDSLGNNMGSDDSSKNSNSNSDVDGNTETSDDDDNEPFVDDSLMNLAPSNDQLNSKDTDDLSLKLHHTVDINHRKTLSSFFKLKTSNLFQHVGNIGNVIDKNPFCLTQLGTEHFLVASLTNYVVVYDLHKLRISYIGRVLPFRIKLFYAWGEIVFIAIKNNFILKTKRNEILAIYRGHNLPVIGMFMLGGTLLSYSKKEVILWLDNQDHSSDSRVSNENHDENYTKILTSDDKVNFDISSDSFQHSILNFLLIDDPDFEISSAIHPDAYLNKILLCSAIGAIRIYNIRTKKLVYQIKSLEKLDYINYYGYNYNKNDENNGITCICKTAFNIDILAFGTVKGDVYVIDIKKDILLMHFKHDQSHGQVVSLDFFDSNKSKLVNSSSLFGDGTHTSYLLCGTQDGSLSIWDLQKQELCIVHKKIHSSITKVQCIDNKPLLVTSGSDNLIILWIFDVADGLPRILKKRGGLQGDIHKLEFYDEETSNLIGCCVNSEGASSVAKISTIQQQRNVVMSQRNLSRVSRLNTLRSIIDFAFSKLRHYDWPNMVTIHKSTHNVFIWNLHNNCLDRKVLKFPKGRTRPFASSVIVSRCGNFAIVGYEDGSIHRYNMQSGFHRESYNNPSLKDKAHLGRICSLQLLDSISFLSASSHTEDKRILKWNIISHKLEDFFDFGTESEVEDLNRMNITKLRLSGNSCICAVVLSDHLVYICDIIAKIIIHRLNLSNKSLISDLCFSRDCRWIAICTYDCCMYVHDIPSFLQIDWIRFKSPVLALTFHPYDNFLYTSHMNSRGCIRVWSNKHIFDAELTVPILAGIPKIPIEIDEQPGCKNNDFGLESKKKYDNLMKTVNDDNLEKTDKKIDSNYTDDQKIELLNEDQELWGYSLKSVGLGNTFSKEPLEKGALTLSGLHFNIIQSIQNWNMIVRKNQPKKELEKCDNAPFFLPNSYILDNWNDFDFDHKNDEPTDSLSLNSQAQQREHSVSEPQISDVHRSNSNHDSSHPNLLTRKDKLSLMEPKLNTLLQGIGYDQQDNSKKFTEIYQYLSALSPKDINLALLQLRTIDGENREMLAMLRFFKHYVETRNKADFIQAVFSAFLQIHGDHLTSNVVDEECIEILDHIEKLIYEDAIQTDEIMQKIVCYLKICTQIQI